MTGRRSRAVWRGRRSCPSSRRPSSRETTHAGRPTFPVASVRMATTMPGSRLVSDDLEARAIAWRRHLHAHPELSFEEHETSAFIEETLRSFGGLEIERPAGTAGGARPQGARPRQGGGVRGGIAALPVLQGKRD